jgi:uncharacterized protein (DUF3084 family)
VILALAAVVVILPGMLVPAAILAAVFWFFDA